MSDTAPAPSEATPQQAAPQSAPAQPQASEPPKWLSQVSPERRENKELHGYATLNDLADDALAMKRDRGRALLIPDEKATPQDIRAFYDRLGVPKDAQGYGIKGEGVPEGEKLSAAFADQAIKAGLTKGQAAKQWEFLSGLVKNGQGEQQRQASETRDTFDARLDQALRSTIPEDSKREDAKKETVNMLKRHLARMDKAVGKAYVDKGLIYDTDFVLAIAADERKRGDAPFVDGSVSPKSDRPVGSYHPDFINAYKR